MLSLLLLGVYTGVQCGPCSPDKGTSFYTKDRQLQFRIVFSLWRNYPLLPAWHKSRSLETPLWSTAGAIQLECGLETQSRCPGTMSPYPAAVDRSTSNLTDIFRYRGGFNGVSNGLFWDREGKCRGVDGNDLILTVNSQNSNRFRNLNFLTPI